MFAACCQKIINSVFLIFKEILLAFSHGIKKKKKNSIIAQFKALNERIPEWAYFLNLDKRFQRYLHFSVRRGVL